MKKLDEWLATRPKSVRALAAEFPIGTRVSVGDEKWFVIGYTETDMLIVSPVDIQVNYDAAYNQRQLICAAHCRAAA